MINKDDISDKNWRAMADFAILHARQNKSLKDYKRSCQNLPRTRNSSYQAREKILDTLIGTEIVFCEGGILKINTSHDFFWLRKSLNNGCPIAWDFLNSTTITPKKYDDSNKKEIGQKGEDFVIDSLQKSLVHKSNLLINHVSKFDDSVGFDIEIEIDGRLIQMEIKTTTRPFTDFKFYLSQNEFQVSQQNLESWFVILVRIENNKPKLEGYLPASKFTEIMPSNIPESNVNWESASVVAPPKWILAGLPVE